MPIMRIDHKGGLYMADEDRQRPRSGYSELIGYRVRKRDTGYCELELAVEPKHLNRLNVPHGGVLATLVDTAAGFAVALAQGPDKILPAVTLSLSMQFLGQAKVGEVLIATARRIGGGRTIAHGPHEMPHQAGS